ncbi:MAG: hypothetical protein ACR2NA_14110 [Solirubrobacterales bacterium]
MRPAGIALVVAAIVASFALIGAYGAAGGSDYEPLTVRDPCEPRAWRDPAGAEELGEQLVLSALDGTACRLRVSREELALSIADAGSVQAFRRRYRIDEAQFEAAVRTGLVRAVDDARDAGAIGPVAATLGRALANRIPVDEALRLLRDGEALAERLGELNPFG